MYSVRWKSDVRTALDIRWITASPELRRRIREAVREVKLFLETNPFGQGESRQAGHRIMYVDPLWITYEIDRQRSIVRVVDIGLP